jgi:hypothetical protein
MKMLMSLRYVVQTKVLGLPALLLPLVTTEVCDREIEV